MKLSMENEGKIKCINFYPGYRFLNWNHKSRNIEKNTSRITPVSGLLHCSGWAFSGLLTGAGGHVDDVVGVVMWSKSGDSSISMREIITTSVLKGFDKKKIILKGAVGSSALMWDWYRIWPLNFTQV